MERLLWRWLRPLRSRSFFRSQRLLQPRKASNRHCGITAEGKAGKCVEGGVVSDSLLGNTEAVHHKQPVVLLLQHRYCWRPKLQYGQLIIHVRFQARSPGVQGRHLYRRRILSSCVDYDILTCVVILQLI